MTCKWCGSDEQRRFKAEVAIHFPGLKGIDKLAVFVFPELLVCLNCGKTEFTIPESELQMLTEGEAPAAS